MNKKLVLTWLVVALCSWGVAAAQEGAPFSKTLPGGLRLQLRTQTVTEFRSRPPEANPGVPAEELFQNQEWRLTSRSLFLSGAGGDNETLLWRHTSSHSAKELQQYPDLNYVAVQDVWLGDRTAHVLYRVVDTYIVDYLRKDDYGVWIPASPPAVLARSYEFQPIFKAGFSPASKPQIVIEYRAGGKQAGKIRPWRWDFDGTRWRKR